MESLGELNNGKSRFSKRLRTSGVFVTGHHYMAKDKTSDQALSKVLGVSDKNLKKHSELYYWMLKNHDALKAAFEASGPQWPVRVQAMGEAGLTDRTGKPPSVKTAQTTWYTVCRAVEANRSEQTRALPRPIPTPAATSTVQPTQPLVVGADDHDDEEEIEITMGDGTPRKVKIPKQR